MAVYVDNARIPYGRMVMCHMVADDLKELHQMAGRIGINRKWFQDANNHRIPHYDICLSKRAEAIKNGAIEITREGLIRFIKEKNKND